MADKTLFFRSNKVRRENVFFPATESLKGEDGKPLMWELRPVSTKEDDQIRAECTREVPVPGRAGVTRTKFDTLAYPVKLAVHAVVAPDLHDPELQGSYGVMGAEDLLLEMIDAPGEFLNLTLYIQEMSGLNVTPRERVEEAKN